MGEANALKRAHRRACCQDENPSVEWASVGDLHHQLPSVYQRRALRCGLRRTKRLMLGENQEGKEQCQKRDR